MAEPVTVCIACSGKRFEPYCPGVIKCKKCGMVVAKEIPTGKELHDLYQQDYFFGMEYADYVADRPALEHNFKRRIARLKRIGALKQGDNVVELGSAYGYFLDLLKPIAGKYIGFDVSEEGIKESKSRGHNATTKDFLDYPIKDSSVDLVCMWDVAEHLTHPDKYIEKINRILKPGGYLALTTGDVSALIARARGGKWRMIHPPTHVYYFSPETLQKVFARSGLDTVKVWYKGTARNAGSIAEQIISNRKALKKSTRILEFGQSLMTAAKMFGQNKQIHGEALRYVVSGVLSLVVETGLFYVLHSIFGLQLYIANSVSYILTIVFNFTLLRYWVFKAGRDDSINRQGAKMAVLYAFNLLLSNGLIGLYAQLIGAAFLAKCLTVATIAVWNFVIMRSFIFTKNKV